MTELGILGKSEQCLGFRELKSWLGDGLRESDGRRMVTHQELGVYLWQRGVIKSASTAMSVSSLRLHVS